MMKSHSDMLMTASPYQRAATNLRENGFHVMPVGPGTKVPGQWQNGMWLPMAGWSKFCDTPPPDFVHDQWERWQDAGVCIAHGNVIGLDLDTDRQDVAQALHRAVVPPTVRRRGAKGWLGYYRPGPGLDDETARVRWYDPTVLDPDGKPSKTPVVELLLHGTQSVLPPTIHPGTGQPYIWTTPDTLENTDISDLPVFGGDDLAALDREFSAIGLSRKAPNRMGDSGPITPTGADLEKPFGRSLNDRAMEPAAIDQWWPAMGLPKTRQRGHGAWEAVAPWRGSGQGRQLMDRNPNLKIRSSGIRDFGSDEPFTPIDLVMRWRSGSFQEAVDWLSTFVRDEVGAVPFEIKPPEQKPDEPLRDLWQEMPSFAGSRPTSTRAAIPIPNEREYLKVIPREPQPFPIRNFLDNCPGLLGEVAHYLDAASATATEAGALAVAVPLLGALMGRGYETPTGLRSNIYTVAIGGSGSGKTSLVNPAKELLALAKAQGILGQDRIASGTGLLRMLEGNAPKICFLDEFGHMLKQIGSSGSGVHAQQIITEFTALYSAANTVFAGTAYATQEPRMIDCPHLCLFGMATPDQFWAAFGSGALEDGSVARYLVFPIGESAPKEPDKTGQHQVAYAMEAVTLAMAGRARGNLAQTQVCRLGIDAGAETARQSLIATMKGCASYAEGAGIKGAPAILMRVAENATKIALVSAVGRDIIAPQINEHDFAIGHALARWSATTMISNIASHIADNQYERDVNAVERRVKAAGAEGILQGKLFNALRSIRPRDKQEILEGLINAGIVEKRQVKTATKSGWSIVHIGSENTK